MLILMAIMPNIKENIMSNSTVQFTHIDYLKLGAELQRLNRLDIIDVLGNKQGTFKVSGEQWLNGCIMVSRNNHTEISNQFAKIALDMDGGVFVIHAYLDQVENGLIKTLDVLTQMTKVDTAPKAIKSPVTLGGTRTTVVKTILPPRSGNGYRKGYDAIRNIIEPHLLSKDDMVALSALNVDIRKYANLEGGSYTDPLSDVIIRVDGYEVIIEADTFSLQLNAKRTSGHATPYAALSYIDARNEEDVSEVSRVLHAINNLIKKRKS